MRTITQGGEWDLPDDDIFGMMFDYAVRKICNVTNHIKLRELFNRTADVTRNY